jgi:hypothetical protein
MARLTLTPNLTWGYSKVLEKQIRSTHEGQAYFGGSGPSGATCGECVFLGYFRQHYKNGNPVKAARTGGCAKFHALTGKHGPVVPKYASACRYFKRKEEEK